MEGRQLLMGGVCRRSLVELVLQFTRLWTFTSIGADDEVFGNIFVLRW